MNFAADYKPFTMTINIVITMALAQYSQECHKQLTQYTVCISTLDSRIYYFFPDIVIDE